MTENHESSHASLVPGARSPLVTLRPGGTRRPLFLIHGAGGHVFQFQMIASLFDEDQPVYGLEAVGLWGDQPVIDNVLDMATRYISEIRKVQPTGPYLLAGFSMGGLISAEMARLLRQQGEEVALGMLDAPAPDSYPESPRLWRGFLHNCNVLWFHTYTFIRQPWKRKQGYLREPFRQRMRRLGKLLGNDRLHRWALNIGRPAPPGFAQIRDSYGALLDGATVGLGDVPISVFRARVQDPDTSWDLGWKEHSSETFEVIAVPGYHPYMFVHPHNRQLVRELSSWVSRMDQHFG